MTTDATNNEHDSELDKGQKQANDAIEGLPHCQRADDAQQPNSRGHDDHLAAQTFAGCPADNLRPQRSPLPRLPSRRR